MFSYPVCSLVIGWHWLIGCLFPRRMAWPRRRLDRAASKKSILAVTSLFRRRLLETPQALCISVRVLIYTIAILLTIKHVAGADTVSLEYFLVQKILTYSDCYLTSDSLRSCVIRARYGHISRSASEGSS